MREFDDAALELKLRRVLGERLGALPLELNAETLERRRVIREKVRRRRRVVVGLGIAATLVLPLGWLAAGAPTPQQSDRSVAVPTPAFPSPAPIPARVGVDHLLYSADGDIYLADPDGQNPVRIADGGPNGGFWSVFWSPDGHNLSYTGEDSVHVADVTGKVLFSTPGCCSAWSPDGSLMATLVVDRTLSSRPDANPGQVEVNFVGRDGVRRSGRSWGASANFLGSGVNIHWTPDGRAITITGVTFGSGAPDVGPGWLIPVDGGSTTRLAVLPAERSKSYYSPDGTRLVGFDGRFVVAAADGSGVRRLVLEGNLPAVNWYSALWSPDGTRIAASATSDRGDALYVIDVATGALTLLSESLVVADTWSPIDAISWDGQRDRILFRSKDGLSTIGSDGSDPRVLIAGVGGYDGAFQPASGGSR